MLYEMNRNRYYMLRCLPIWGWWPFHCKKYRQQMSHVQWSPWKTCCPYLYSVHCTEKVFHLEIVFMKTVYVKTVKQQPAQLLWSVECGVWSAKCELWSGAARLCDLRKNSSVRSIRLKCELDAESVCLHLIIDSLKYFNVQDKFHSLQMSTDHNTVCDRIVLPLAIQTFV